MKQRVIITGGSRGLGLALAKAFVEKDVECLLIAKNQQRLEIVQSQLGSKVAILACDLSQADQLVLHAQQIQQFEANILINNAAILGAVMPSWQISSQSWQSVMQVNFFAAVELSRLVLPTMLEHKWGRIINLSGGGATNCRPLYNAYACSKTALNKYTETLSGELPEGITINSIAPGMMATDMLMECYQLAKQQGSQVELEKIQAIHSKPPIFPAVDLCIALCQPATEHVSGKLISADWDNWSALIETPHLCKGELYTMRRVTKVQ